MTHDAHDAQEQAARFATGLYDLADWLTEHDIPLLGSTERILYPLHTNAAVEDFAARAGLSVVYDDEGNASATATFGPVCFHVYGYADRAATFRRHDERQARQFAAENGLELVPAAG